MLGAEEGIQELGEEGKREERGRIVGREERDETTSDFQLEVLEGVELVLRCRLERDDLIAAKAEEPEETR